MRTERHIIDTVRNTDNGLVTETTLEIKAFDSSDRYAHRGFMKAQLQGDPEADDFIPFNELTEENLLNWTIDQLTEESIADKEQELLAWVSNREQEQSQATTSDGLPSSIQPETPNPSGKPFDL